MSSLQSGKTGNHFLDSLRSETLALFRAYLVEVHLERGQVLIAPGAELDFVCLPVTATLCVVTTMEDGGDVEACTIGHESAYGLLNALGSSIALDRVVAQIPGRAIKMPAFRLRAAAAISPGITSLVIRHAQANTAQIQQSVACNALHRVEARLCRWLLMTHDRTQSASLPLTQEFLGSMLGVQRTTVSGIAAALQRAGLIRYARGNIEILNRAGLEASACECYRAVGERYAQLFGETRPADPAWPGSHPTAEARYQTDRAQER
ncbi:MAG TPA: Crp/Fnr family transcriptional regulator [Caulobacteraceae bacterium]|jgi:CRP-like cAMP-binding protein|nr:Crp/Fnr family transcriptional regulator [Caulobacteraceae bacterium]